MMPDGSGDLASILAKLQSSLDLESGGEPLSAGDMQVLPRSVKRKRRAKEDRGLPPDDELRRLATAYLIQQRSLWPHFAGSELLPEPSDTTILAFVEDFKHRHRTGFLQPECKAQLNKLREQLAGAYARYSCDNSDPKSIIDQLHMILVKARELNQFIPWAFVFCDYSVTGMDAGRRGYRSYRLVLQETEHRIVTTYIDDFTRASRDELEWWKIAAFSKRHSKDLIGASDNFRLSDPDWDMKIGMYGLMSRLFLKSLRQKVRRGMHGTSRAGGTLGMPPLGFSRKHKTDATGNVLIGPDGQAKTELAHDPGTQHIARSIWELAAMHAYTPYRIARLLNEHAADNWQGWEEETIHKILRNPAYLGVFIWNRTRREFDDEREGRVTVRNPRREWTIYVNRSLALIPDAWWKTVRRKYGPVVPYRLPGRARRAPRRMASWLFDNIAMCGYCGKPIRLCRSTEKYRNVYCVTGSHQSHGCRLRTSKSAKIVESCLLSFLHDSLITEESLIDLVRRANAYLVEEAARPMPDLGPAKKRVREFEAAIRRLVGLIERHHDDTACDAYHVRIKELQSQLEQARKEVRELQGASLPPPPPLDPARVQTYLADLRAVLCQEQTVARERLRTLTGLITITQETVPGRKRGAKWIAKFSPDLMKFLAEEGRARDYPDSITLEYLSKGIWTTLQSTTLVIDGVPRYERLAPRVMTLYSELKTINAVANALGMNWRTVRQIINFATTGKRPTWKQRKSRGRKKGTAEVPKYVALAEEVACLIGKERLSFPAAARWLLEHKGVRATPATIRRAWSYASRESQGGATAPARLPLRHPGYSHLPAATFEKIRARLVAGDRVTTIARELGCGASTVYRVRRTIMRKKGESGR